MDPDQLLEEMTSKQIGVWLAFDAVEPIGRDWERTATLALLHVLAAGGQEFEAEQFAPRSI